MRYSEILVENRRLEPTQSLFVAPLGVTYPVGISPKCLAAKKLESLGYRMALLA